MRQISLRNKRVLVAGGSGVIGHELLIKLISSGAQVLNIDRKPIPLEFKKKVRHQQIDLAVDDLTFIKRFSPQLIFHLAASFERSQESSEFWKVNWQDNLLATHRLLELVKELNTLRTFVFASSYLIYSPQLYLTHSVSLRPRKLYERDKVAPRNLVGMAKYYAENELNFLRDHFKKKLRIINARIFRVYGLGSQDVISRWVKIALSGGEIRVYNSRNQFDYIYAADVAEGLVRLSRSTKATGIINLGTGKSHQPKEIIDILRQKTPKSFKVKNLGKREMVESSCADISRLEKLIGWLPKTTFKEGIEQVIEYEKVRQS